MSAASTGSAPGRGYNRGVSRYYRLDEANAALPDLVPVIDRLREQRRELMILRDAWSERAGAAIDELPPEPAAADEHPDLRILRLRMRGLVDQMAADVAWFDERGIVLRDIETGLLDFATLAEGRQVWLCWRSGETEVAWWHTTSEGFANRRPLDALPGPAASA